MDKALIGFIVIFGFFHVLLIVVPISDTLKAKISPKSKLIWITFLVLLPFFAVAYFHFRFRSSMYQGKPYEPTAHDLGAISPTKGSNKDRH
ncbi:MAG: hypothetical protein AAF434_12415 [Pseudomonadota bacterium]